MIYAEKQAGRLSINAGFSLWHPWLFQEKVIRRYQLPYIFISFYFVLAWSLRKASNVLSESYCQNGPAILAQAWYLYLKNLKCFRSHPTWPVFAMAPKSSLAELRQDAMDDAKMENAVEAQKEATKKEAPQVHAGATGGVNSSWSHGRCQGNGCGRGP